MKIELTDDIIDMLLTGTDKIPYGGLTGKYRHLTHFSGNQWNENWAWNKSKMKNYTIGEKVELYETLTGKKLETFE